MYIDLYSNQPPKKYYPTEIIVIHYCSICLGVVLIVIDYLHIPNDYVFTYIYTYWYEKNTLFQVIYIYSYV